MPRNDWFSRLRFFKGVCCLLQMMEVWRQQKKPLNPLNQISMSSAETCSTKCRFSCRESSQVMIVIIILAELHKIFVYCSFVSFLPCFQPPVRTINSWRTWTNSLVWSTWRWRTYLSTSAEICKTSIRNVRYVVLIGKTNQPTYLWKRQQLSFLCLSNWIQI